MNPIQFLPFVPAILDRLRPTLPPPLSCRFDRMLATASLDSAPFHALPPEERARAAASHLGEAVLVRLHDGTRLTGRLGAILGTPGDLRLEIEGRAVPDCLVRDLEPLLQP